jgi:mannose-1-phosphate guanylyltransferase/mannose-6-phosphate isomerase
MSKIIAMPVILSGGSGSRLWPLSREYYPKQFLELKQGDTLFQQAFKRVLSVGTDEIEITKPIVLTSENNRFIAKSQLEGKDADYILEPFSRNTAPALTFAALKSMECGEDPVMLVTPADHHVENSENFNDAIQRAIQLADGGDVVVLGVKPSKPEIGYGYIKCKGILGKYGEYEVEHFVEKPDLEKAKKFIELHEYLWNSGVFVLKVSTWLKALSMFRPDIMNASDLAWQTKKRDGDFIKLDANLFELIPAESIDYAVMEKLPIDLIKVNVIQLDAGWSDLGNWDAIWNDGDADEQGNVISGDVILDGTSTSLVFSDRKLAVIVGVENLVVIDTPDALLVANKSNSQRIKKIYNEMSLKMRGEVREHTKVNRPWGWYESVDKGEGFKVKRIQVNPGASLSLQKHRHRSEHWIIIKGIAEIFNGNEKVTLTANQSTFIPAGQLHRLSNPGENILEIVEVQTGDIIDENDITRLEDCYGRV